jgi:hypothetical protein
VTAYNPGTALRQRADILAEPQWQLTFTQHDGHGCNTCIWVSNDQLHAGLLPPDADIRPARGTRAIIPGKPKKSKARKATYTVNYSFPDKVVPWHDAAVNFRRQTLGHGLDADKTIALRLSLFKPNTVKSYSTGWNRFTDFCARSGQAPLPQTREMVMTWISVALTINANNMQSYLTAANDAHMDTKAGPAPALVIDVRATINGLKNRQVSLKKTKDVRVFRAHDADDSGEIEYDELQSALRAGFKPADIVFDSVSCPCVMLYYAMPYNVILFMIVCCVKQSFLLM